VHTERGITYALFNNVGALIPRAAPDAGYAFYRDFVLKAATTGTITVDSNGHDAVLGGENASVAVDVPRVASAVYLGQATTTTTVLVPDATLAAWEAFVAPSNVTTPSPGVRAATVGWMELASVALLSLGAVLL
jgi:carboxypeptidase D